MSDCYVNIRFGIYHFQISKHFVFRWSKNPYWIENKPNRWLEIYEFRIPYLS
jgi:hypothetical protein